MTTLLAGWGLITLIAVVAIVLVLWYLNNKGWLKKKLDKVQDK